MAALLPVFTARSAPKPRAPPRGAARAVPLSLSGRRRSAGAAAMLHALRGADRRRCTSSRYGAQSFMSFSCVPCATTRAPFVFTRFCITALLIFRVITPRLRASEVRRVAAILDAAWRSPPFLQLKVCP